MKYKSGIFAILLTMMLISCGNTADEDYTEKIEINNSGNVKNVHDEISVIKRDSIIKQLQGKWKETAYPFRQVQFENETAKFIEEGVVEEPSFKKYNISDRCPFDVNNIKNARSHDLFLVMVGASACEILRISNDTLILSGFNVSTNSIYNIVYKKVE